jgi:hypothetical protein
VPATVVQRLRRRGEHPALRRRLPVAAGLPIAHSTTPRGVTSEASRAVDRVDRRPRVGRQERQLRAVFDEDLEKGVVLAAGGVEVGAAVNPWDAHCRASTPALTNASRACFTATCVRRSNSLSVTSIG